MGRAWGGKIDCLVLNAGISPPIPLLADTTPESWSAPSPNPHPHTLGRVAERNSSAASCCQARRSTPVTQPLPGRCARRDKIFDVNVKSNMILCTMCQPHLTDNSSIVFISSAGGCAPPPPGPHDQPPRPWPGLPR